MVNRLLLPVPSFVQFLRLIIELKKKPKFSRASIDENSAYYTSDAHNSNFTTRRPVALAVIEPVGKAVSLDPLTAAAALF